MRRLRLRLGDGAVQVAFVLAAVSFYELARAAIEPDWARATAGAGRIVRLEDTLGIAWEAPLQRACLALPNAVRFLNAFYLGHFLFTGLFFVWLYRRSRPGFALFRDGFAAAFVLSALVYWWYPVAPPRLAGIGVVDTLRQLSGIDIGSPASVAFSNPVAAMPSLHAGFAVGVGIGLYHYGGRIAKALALFYPALVVLTILATGNHFLLDALAGAIVVALGLGIAAFFLRFRAFQLAENPPLSAILSDATRGGAVR